MKGKITGVSRKMTLDVNQDYSKRYPAAVDTSTGASSTAPAAGENGEKGFETAFDAGAGTNNATQNADTAAGMDTFTPSASASSANTGTNTGLNTANTEVTAVPTGSGSTDVQTLAEEKAQVDESVAQNRETQTQAEQTATEAQQEAQTQEQTASTLTSENEEIKAEATALEENTNQLEETNSSLEETNSGLESENKGLLGTLSEVMGAISQAASDAVNFVTGLVTGNNDTAALESRKTEIQNKIDENGRQIEENENKINENEGQISENETEQGELEEQESENNNGIQEAEQAAEEAGETAKEAEGTAQEAGEAAEEGSKQSEELGEKIEQAGGETTETGEITGVTTETGETTGVTTETGGIAETGETTVQESEMSVQPEQATQETVTEHELAQPETQQEAAIPQVTIPVQEEAPVQQEVTPPVQEIIQPIVESIIESNPVKEAVEIYNTPEYYNAEEAVMTYQDMGIDIDYGTIVNASAIELDAIVETARTQEIMKTAGSGKVVGNIATFTNKKDIENNSKATDQFIADYDALNSYYNANDADDFEVKSFLTLSGSMVTNINQGYVYDTSELEQGSADASTLLSTLKTKISVNDGSNNDSGIQFTQEKNKTEGILHDTQTTLGEKADDNNKLAECETEFLNLTTGYNNADSDSEQTSYIKLMKELGKKGERIQNNPESQNPYLDDSLKAAA